MPTQLYLLADSALPPEAIEACRSLGGSLSAITNTSLLVAYLDGDALNDIRARIKGIAGPEDTERIDPPPPLSNAPMSAAPFRYRDDGRPDWASMWESFCELALYGGPPHRGEDSALTLDSGEPAPEEGFDAIAEIRRGIWETTGLYSEPAEPGWLAVSCNSRKMAAWLCAAIILENVDALCDEDRLLVPAQPGFRLKDEVKSVITVLAKTNHYWSAHAQEQAAIAGRASA